MSVCWPRCESDVGGSPRPRSSSHTRRTELRREKERRLPSWLLTGHWQSVRWQYAQCARSRAGERGRSCLAGPLFWETSSLLGAEKRRYEPAEPAGGRAMTSRPDGSLTSTRSGGTQSCGTQKRHQARSCGGTPAKQELPSNAAGTPRRVVGSSSSVFVSTSRVIHAIWASRLSLRREERRELASETAAAAPEDGSAFSALTGESASAGAAAVLVALSPIPSVAQKGCERLTRRPDCLTAASIWRCTRAQTLSKQRV